MSMYGYARRSSKHTSSKDRIVEILQKSLGPPADGPASQQGPNIKLSPYVSDPRPETGPHTHKYEKNSESKLSLKLQPASISTDSIPVPQPEGPHAASATSPPVLGDPKFPKANSESTFKQGTKSRRARNKKNREQGGAVVAAITESAVKPSDGTADETEYKTSLSLNDDELAIQTRKKTVKDENKKTNSLAHLQDDMRLEIAEILLQLNSEIDHIEENLQK